MTSNRARTVLVLAGLLIASVPAWAQHHPYRERSYHERDGAFRLRVGAFRPDADSEYWNDKKLDFTGDASDFEDASVGADYVLSLNRNVGVMFSGSYYQGNATQSYRDFVDNRGDRIRHDTTLDIGSLTAGLVFNLTGPDAPISPYVGAGGGLYSWRLEESGDFIDFNTPHRDIFSANLKADGVGFGYYFLAGLEAPITRRVSVFAEGRWTKVDDDLNGDFEGFGKLDLSGREVAAGISWNL
jgi:opacity protein-like surface antigen